MTAGPTRRFNRNRLWPILTLTLGSILVKTSAPLGQLMAHAVPQFCCWPSIDDIPTPLVSRSPVGKHFRKSFALCTSDVVTSFA